MIPKLTEPRHVNEPRWLGIEHLHSGGFRKKYTIRDACPSPDCQTGDRKEIIFLSFGLLEQPPKIKQGICVRFENSVGSILLYEAR